MGELIIKQDYFNKTERLLKNYRSIKKHIEILELRKLEIIELKSRGIKNISLDSMGSKMVSSDKIGNEVVKIIEMEEKVQADLNSEKFSLKLIERGLAVLTQDQQEIIQMRYFDNIPDEKIGEFIGYNRSQIYRKRIKALREISVCLYGDKCIHVN